MSNSVSITVCVSHPRLCETVVPLEDPIITETTSTLQEWGVLWKQLYVVSTVSPLTGRPLSSVEEALGPFRCNVQG